MSTTHERQRSTRSPAPHRTHPAGITAETPSGTVAAWIAGLTRLALGWVFLWAFLDKAFGLGHETAAKDAWINGGSPTRGFLAFAATGPFEGFYHDIAGATWADWLFMIGLIGIGVALVLGIGMRVAATAGVVLLVLMWSVVLPPADNVFMDDHLIYAMVLVLLAAGGAGRTLGFGRYWEGLPLVKRHRWLV